MPCPLFGETLVGTFDPVGFVPGLVRGDRDELAGHEAALVRVQIEPATLNSLDPHRVLLDQVDHVLQLPWLPVQAVHMPHDDDRDPGADMRYQAVVSRTAAPIERGDVVVDEDQWILIPELCGKSEAVLLLALHAGTLTRTILRDPQIHRRAGCRRFSHETRPLSLGEIVLSITVEWIHDCVDTVDGADKRDTDTVLRCLERDRLAVTAALGAGSVLLCCVWNEHDSSFRRVRCFNSPGWHGFRRKPRSVR
nr:hypothetical protein [Microbacterium sp. JB110]